MEFIPVEHRATILSMLRTVEAKCKDMCGHPVNIHISPKDTEYAIKHYVCNSFGVSWQDVTSKCRKAQLVEARQVYCYLMREWTVTPLANIGQALGGRDHTTIVHSVNKIKELLSIKDPSITTIINSFNLNKDEIPHD